MGKLDPKFSPFKVNAVHSASFVIGAESGGDVINVAIQLKDVEGNDIAQRAGVLAYISDDANGDSVTSDSIDTVAIGTDGVLVSAPTAGKAFLLVSESDGDIDLNLTEAGANTYYLVLIMPDGSLSVSDAITFAA